MKKLVASLFLVFIFLPVLVWASPPVPYSGKVAINGVNFFGQAKFAFAIHDANGTVHWRNGATANDTISVNVANGRYVVHLGGQGMNPLPASLFADHDELYVGVRFDIGDGKGLVYIARDQRITAVPYALTAKSVEKGAITTAHLNEQILKYLKPEITQYPQAPNLIFSGQTVTLNSQAEGKFLTYQWSKNGQPISGAVLKDLVITDSNSSLHDGNYTLVVTNDFGSVETQPVPVLVSDPNKVKPRITQIPRLPHLIFPGLPLTLQVNAEGTDRNYQWFKNGQPIVGATLESFVLQNFDENLDEGNYSVSVSNAFGSVMTVPLAIKKTSGVIESRTISGNNVASYNLDLGEGYSDFIVLDGNFTSNQCTAFTGSNPDSYTRSDSSKVLLTLQEENGRVRIEESSYAGTNFCYGAALGLGNNGQVTFRIFKF